MSPTTSPQIKTPPAATPSTAAVFAALGDEQRLSLLERLGDGPTSATALAGPLSISRQAVVKHLQIMRAAGLVDTRRSGREVLYTARADGLREPTDWLTAHAAAWRRRLQDLKTRAE